MAVLVGVVQEADNCMEAVPCEDDNDDHHNDHQLGIDVVDGIVIVYELHNLT
jgi:hypothetical protein